MKPYQAAVHAVMLAPDASSTAARTANLDCQGADFATISLNVSVEANTNSTNVICDVLESDDTVVTNFATFASAHSVTVDNTAAANHAFHVPLNGRKRYLRLTVTPDTTTNGAVLVSAISLVDNEIKASSNSTNESIG